MLNMADLIPRYSHRNTDGKSDQIWKSKIDLDYAYGE